MAHEVGSDKRHIAHPAGQAGTPAPTARRSSRSRESTRMLTLRARASVPPIAATSNPVAAASPHAATASSTKPTNEPVTATPKTTVAEPERHQHLQERDGRPWPSTLPASTQPSGTGAARMRDPHAAPPFAKEIEPALHAPEQQVLQRHAAKAVRVRIEPASAFVVGADRSQIRNGGASGCSSAPASPPNFSRVSRFITTSVTTPSAHCRSAAAVGWCRMLHLGPITGLTRLPVLQFSNPAGNTIATAGRLSATAASASRHGWRTVLRAAARTADRPRRDR